MRTGGRGRAQLGRIRRPVVSLAVSALSDASSRTALLRNPALLALLARDVVSSAGSQMTWVALPWFVLTTTGSATRMAIVVAVEAAALGIVGFAAGDLAARLGARRTMLVADACRAPLMALIPTLHHFDLLSFPLLLVLVFAVGSFGTSSFASRAAIVPDIVGEDEGVVGEANALRRSPSGSRMILGPCSLASSSASWRDERALHRCGNLRRWIRADRALRSRRRQQTGDRRVARRDGGRALPLPRAAAPLLVGGGRRR